MHGKSMKALMVRGLSRFFVLLVLSTLFLLNPAHAALKPEIDYNKLVDILGEDLPLGTGVAVSIVEASSGGYYFPDTSNAEFTAGDDPFGTAVNWTNGSGVGIPSPSESSNHATNVVGRTVFGNSFGVAPAANDVTVYEADDFINNVLGVQSNTVPNIPNTAGVPDYLVQNHSYISSSSSSDAENLSALRRLDYVIDTYDITMSVGLNNNGNSSTDPDPSQEHPDLYSYSYNAIAVGTSDGGHSRGVTDSLYGVGRRRPDIVAPMNTTSAATASVASVATMLHEVVADTDGAKSETMRAILMAGATKDEFATYVEPSTSVANPWTRNPNHPLDDLFGAGELNALNSYLISAGGKQSGGLTSPATVGSYGWDYQSSITPSNDIEYEFVIPAGSTAQELSIVLSWNIEVEDTDPGLNFVPEELPLANLDMVLLDSTGATVDSSVSTLYPVEHIYRTDLGPGTYTLRVSSDTAQDYGLAWRMSTLFDTPSADFNDNGSIDSFDFLSFQRGYGTLMGATNAMGDADGDGDVDDDDLAILMSTFGLPASAFISTATSVPEPTSLLILGTGVLAFHLLRRKHR